MHRLLLAATTLPLTDPFEFVDTAARAGYAGVGLRLYQASGGPTPLVHDPRLIRELKARIVDSGMEVLDVFSCYLRPDTDFEGLRAALACGAALGAKYALAICADTEWPRLVDHLARLCALTAEYGIVPAIEAPLQGRIIASVEGTLQLADEAGGTSVVCLDTYQIFRTGDTLAAVHTQPERFPYVQLADGFASPVSTLLPGEGSVPLRAIVDALPGGLPLSLECVPPTDQPFDPLTWSKLVLDAAQRALSDEH